MVKARVVGWISAGWRSDCGADRKAEEGPWRRGDARGRRSCGRNEIDIFGGGLVVKKVVIAL